MQSCRRIDSSSIIAHPLNFDIQRERSLKCDAKNSTYIYTYHPLNNRYGFSLSIGNTKNHVTTLTCLEWLLKYVNTSVILAPKVISHACAFLIDNVGNYLYLSNGNFKFEVDPHQFNLRLYHFSQFHNKKIDFQKLAGLWLAGEMVNRIVLYEWLAKGLSAIQRRLVQNAHIFY